MRTRHLNPNLKTYFIVSAGLALLWLVLTGGESASWLVGVPVVLAAAWLWLRLGGRAIRFQAAALPALVLFFVRYSVKGGWDVAKRVFSRAGNLRPELVPFDTKLPEGPARILLINCISLMPGTATVDREEGHLRLHVLDVSQPHELDIRALERLIARLFKHPIS